MCKFGNPRLRRDKLCKYANAFSAGLLIRVKLTFLLKKLIANSWQLKASSSTKFKHSQNTNARNFDFDAYIYFTGSILLSIRTILHCANTTGRHLFRFRFLQQTTASGKGPP